MDPLDPESALAGFPPPLRELVRVELAEGNTIVSREHGHPAAPIGAFIRLSRRARADRRCSTPTLCFLERNNTHHAGEFTTAERHFFVLEPPLPQPPPPDMDAIREELAARERAANADRFRLFW